MKGLVHNVENSGNFNPSYENIAKIKSNNTLWIASNCAFSHRNKYISQLRKYGLQVHDTVGPLSLGRLFGHVRIVNAVVDIRDTNYSPHDIL